MKIRAGDIIRHKDGELYIITDIINKIMTNE